jgi:hypothetical protein
MKSYQKVFIFAFLTSAVFALLSNIYLLLFPRLSPSASYFQNYALIYGLSSVASYAISPVLVFVIFYFVGKSIDMPAEFRSVIVALAVGSFIGYVAAYFPLELRFIAGSGVFSSGGMLTVFLIATTVGASLVTGVERVFASTFFVGLAALGLVYIRKKKRSADLGPAESPQPQTNAESLRPEVSNGS